MISKDDMFSDNDVARGSWSGSLSDISETSSSVNSLIASRTKGHYTINGELHLAHQERICVKSGSQWTFKRASELTTDDVFLSRGKVTSSISSIEYTGSVREVVYSLDLENEDLLHSGGNVVSVIGSNSYYS